MKYYIDKTIDVSFAEAVEKVKSALPTYGFGVVTEFDVDEKFKSKLGIDYPSYKIIGACNPKYAYEAILLEPLIGAMLPCNIVVRKIETNKTMIAAIDPVASMQAVENPELNKSATLIKEQLEKLISSL